MSQHRPDPARALERHQNNHGAIMEICLSSLGERSLHFEQCSELSSSQRGQVARGPRLFSSVRHPRLWSSVLEACSTELLP